MKTTFNKLAAVVIFAFILLAGNVRAEGNDVTASSLENATETSLQMENWMTSDSFWSISTSESFILNSEAGLEMENWMTSDSTWEVKKQEVAETENSLQIEDWMTNNKIWNI